MSFDVFEGLGPPTIKNHWKSYILIGFTPKIIKFHQKSSDFDDFCYFYHILGFEGNSQTIRGVKI